MPRLLVVDDRESDRQKVARLLVDLPDVTIEEASDRDSFLAALENPPDIVLTDLHLPDIDGPSVVEAVCERCPYVPVVLMTRHGLKDEAVAALKAGAASFVLKKDLKSQLKLTVMQMIVVAVERRRQDRLARCHTRQHRVLDLPTDPDIIGPTVRLAKRMVEETAAVPAGPRGLDKQEYEPELIGFSETDRLRIGVALEEALTNAVYHGNLELDSEMRDHDEARYYSLARERALLRPYSQRRVRIELTVARTGDPCQAGADDLDVLRRPPSGPNLRFYVEDQGAGFDPASLPDPTDPENLMKAHGRGLLLVRTFMDEATHNAKGNAITLIKTAKGDGDTE
ncbi:ATP-binding protein [Alienimonas chondri]|uniref:Chemotaxis response regulator protein-glutamate methylesterase n=1 Tax=Alienimonas chondri TaxID=2681879 RepID=A0ABX1VA95_9PLAN|nr:response regulator [Alienimonas chondri]NNJ25015.1 Chemotaxis response regulator protein-glutamate methylesterase [Alienimonas chondri]